ncbi:MAG: spore protease YyaC [Lachnospiraceae bacterium]|nr:spore protease YyaC [Lachnospiraceae bacterium]
MQEQTHYYKCGRTDDKNRFINTLFHLLRKNAAFQTPIYILCIGTDKVTGDSLGPFVGHAIERELASLNEKFRMLHLPEITLIGTLREPVHALNLSDTLHHLHCTSKEQGFSFDDCLTLVIDAALGYPGHIGLVTLSNMPLAPGEGVHKKLPKVGQISITGIIGESLGSTRKCQLSLKNARLTELVELSEFISEGILASLRRLYLHFAIIYLNRISDRSSTLLHNGNQNF